MGPILGFTFGGVVGEPFHWRWAFFMIAPLGLAACLPIIAALGDEERGTAKRFDFVGFALIAVAVGCLQLVFDRGQREDWFQSPVIVTQAVIAVACLYFFAAHSFLSKQPLFELAIFRDRNFVLGMVFAVTGWAITPMVLFPPCYKVCVDIRNPSLAYWRCRKLVEFPGCSASMEREGDAGPGHGVASAGSSMDGATRYQHVIQRYVDQFLWLRVWSCVYPMAVLTFSTLESPLTQGNASSACCGVG